MATDRIRIVGAEPKRVNVTDTPQRAVNPASVAAALGAKPTHWFETFDNVTALGRWMIDNSYIATPMELQGYYEKSWLYTSEWNEMQGQSS